MNSMTPKLQTLLWLLLLVSAGEFHSRITLKTKRYPERLLLFVKKLPEEPCDDRKREAKSLLDADWRFLEINALNISILYNSDLERMKSEGTCGEEFWALIYMIAKKWRADTQEVEGLNSALKALIQKAPNVSLVLASARLLIRKMLTIIGANGP